ncbi:DUF4811 domain-containing protein [Streptococcus thoraltensis]|uniref:DUF4811 domain-containing protein n=1 Tax=Streptococcus thoraltensis TaxID=55085 RepID=UPI001F5781BC|nr:DUF4811 domain-containing protein [Streptococcus thoraltensis]
MIIVIIILATVAVFASWMLVEKPVLRCLAGSLSLFVFVGSIAMLTNHFVNHTGMSVKTSEKTKEIYSAAGADSPFGLLIKKEVGSDSNNYVLAYRDKPSDKDATAHFIPKTDEPTEAVKQRVTYKEADVDKATVTTITKRYTWKSDFAKLLYAFGGEDGELISREVTATVPKDTWLVVTKNQADKLPDIAKKLQDENAKANPKAAAALQKLAKENPQAVVAKQVEDLKTALKEEK